MSRKTKNSLLRRFLCTGLVFLMLLPSLPAFAVSQSPFNESTYDAAMLDEEGYNIIGNTPVQLAQGGFYAPQKDWLFYADWTQNGVLCASNGSRTVTLTDYPVANINVSGDRLVFTDLSATVSRRYAADNTFAHDKLTYGGKLYEATGVKALMSGGELGAIRQVGNDAYYYRVGLGKDIYALSGSADVSDWSYVRVADGEITPIVVGSEGESIVNMVDNYMVLYFEIESPGKWGRILRLDATTRQLVDSVPGRELSVLGERIFFISNTNHYLYEMKSNTAQPTVVSSCPIASYAIQDNGDIKALGADGQIELLISLNSGHQGFAGPYQVGEWYNYFKMQYSRPKPEPHDEYDDEVYWIYESVIVYPPEKPPTTSSQPPTTSSQPPTTSSQPPTTSSQPPTQPPKSNKMPPEAAVDMVMVMVKAGTIEDPIFSKYYDAKAKAAFMEYYIKKFGKSFDFANEMDKGIAENAGELFTPEQQKLLADVFKNYYAQHEYTLKVIEQTDSAATVRMHLTKGVDWDMNALEFSDANMMNIMTNYMAEKGLDQSYLYSFQSEAELTDFVLEAMVDYLEKILVPIDVDRTGDIHVKTDEVLNWVLTDSRELTNVLDPTKVPDESGFLPPDPPEDIELPDEKDFGPVDPPEDIKPPLPPNNNEGTTRTPGMECVYEKIIYERETPNMWETMGRDVKKLWNDFWGIETPKYKPVDNHLRTEQARGDPLPGSNLCPKELKVIIPGKPKGFFEMIGDWFS